MNKQGNPGMIIILNGPSASGKTTIQKEVQKKFQQLYLTIGIDDFFDRILPQEMDVNGKSVKNNELIRKLSSACPECPTGAVGDGGCIEGSKDVHGNQIVSLEVGPAGRRVVHGMHRAFAAYAAAGNNLVIDYILYDPTWLPDLVNVLKNFTVYFVGVHIPLEVLEQREKERGTTPIGHARSHYQKIHAHGLYDLELNTAELTPEQCAANIEEYITSNPNPQAFDRLLLFF